MPGDFSQGYSKRRSGVKAMDWDKVTELSRPAAPALASAIDLKALRYAHSSGRPPIVLSSLKKLKRTYQRGARIVSQGDCSGRTFILEQGWTFSSCTLRSGGRQVLDVQVPGDALNLQGLLLPYALNDVTAITDVETFEVSFGDPRDADQHDTEIDAFMIWLIASEGAVNAIRLTNLGRRSALERTAHFILELATRLRLAGLGMADGFPCPLTQYLLADALGLTPVHVNRVFRELRLSNLASHQRGWLSLLDMDRLVVLAEFDSAYLEHAQPYPRE